MNGPMRGNLLTARTKLGRFIARQKLITLALGLVLGLMATNAAYAGCNSGCLPPPPPTPPEHPHGPDMPHAGANAYAQATAIATASATARATVGSYSGANAGSYAVSGGYSNWSQTPRYPENMNLNVVGEEGYAASSYERMMTRMMAIQAYCIDDKDVPHPASQTSPDRQINSGFQGELYRCIAGTHMQVTMVGFGQGADCYSASSSSEYGASRRSSYQSASESAYETYGASSQGGYGSAHRSGHNSAETSAYESSSASSAQGAASQLINCQTDMYHINFSNGKTLSCEKNQALWFDKGQISCRAQIPARPCNERSLLRRFGTGLKVLMLSYKETYTETKRFSQSASASGQTIMVFDGGVGGFVQ